MSNEVHSPNQAVTGLIDFNLHTLGWHAFQDLSCLLLQEMTGTLVDTFAAVKDGGRDGSFVLRLGDTKFGPPGQWVLQCKHTSQVGGNISASMLKADLEKAKQLVDKRICDHYVLMTNYNVTGASEVEIAKKFQEAGVDTFRLISNTTINAYIRHNPHFRALVPRLYGLGDLSQILDSRAYSQAKTILYDMGEELKKLVVTRSQVASVKALQSKRFVLLLGDAMSGKSTIAAALSLSAIDQWKINPIKVTRPSQVVDHWNPEENGQLFWVDDAFGTTQYQKDYAEEWNRSFPHLLSMIRKGCRIILTSRTYIYYAAKNELKTEAFPLLEDSQVIIQVEELTSAEKQQILYNHLKLGQQDQETLRTLGRHGKKIALCPGFLPEIARRLGDPRFTKNLQLDIGSLMHFVKHPKEYLLQIINTSDDHIRAALSLIFMHGGSLAQPVDFSVKTSQAIARLGSNEAQVLKALSSMKNSLTKIVSNAGVHYWSYQHPTISDALAAYVSNNADLIDIYIIGSKINDLIREVVCGNVDIIGAKLKVPPQRFQLMVQRLSELNISGIRIFLRSRCDKEFLAFYLESNPEIFAPLLLGGMYLHYTDLGKLAIHTLQLGLLQEPYRVALASSLIKFTKVEGRLDWKNDTSLDNILNDVENEDLNIFFYNEYLQRMDNYVDRHSDDWDPKDDPERLFSDLSESIDIHAQLTGCDEETTSTAHCLIENAVEKLLQQYAPEPDPDNDRDDYSSDGALHESASDIFSDLVE